MSNEVADRMNEQLEKSNAFLALYTDHFTKNEACIYQLGAAIIKDKPLIIVAAKGTRVPKGLSRAAALIEFVDFNDANDMERSRKSVSEFLKKLNN